MPAVGAWASSLLGQQRTSAPLPALTHPHSQTPPRPPSRWPHPVRARASHHAFSRPQPSPAQPTLELACSTASRPLPARPRARARREPRSAARSRLLPLGSTPPPFTPQASAPRRCAPPVGERNVPDTRCRARRPPLPPQQALSPSPGLAAATTGRPRAPQPPLPSPPPPPTSLGSPPPASFLGTRFSNQRTQTAAVAGCHLD